MTATMIPVPIGKASTTRKIFSRETTLTVVINADAAIVWALLTNASDYTRWNRTIVSIEGNIAKGESIKLISTLDSKRTFKLKIKEAEPEKRLVWGDAMGNRVYAITKLGIGKVEFTMTEKIGGPLFPLFAGMIPPFDASFEQFASCLKTEAEIINNAKN